MKAPLIIHPITTGLESAMREAVKDDPTHDAPPPLATHAFLRGEEIVGGISLFAPTIMFWAHSKRLQARESFELITRCQALAATTPHLVACSASSPFVPFMGRLSYRKLGTADYYELDR